MAQAAARKDQEQNRDLLKLKLMFPDLWKAKVRAARIDPLNLAPNFPGLPSLGHRKAFISQFIQSLKQYVKIEENVPILWLTYDRFLAHCQYVEGKSETWAKAKWLEFRSNPDIVTVGEGDDLEIPVRGIRSTVGTRGREWSRAVQGVGDLNDQSEADAAMKRLALLGSNASLSQAEFGGMGDVFRTGAAASSSSLEACARNFGQGSEQMGVPQSSIVIPPTHFRS